MFHVAFARDEELSELGASSEWEFVFFIALFSVIAMVAKHFGLMAVVIGSACCALVRRTHGT